MSVTGGDKLLERLNELNTLDGVQVTVGLQGQGGAPGGEDDATLVRIGRAHELGLGVPQRPFLRTALSRGRTKWTRMLRAPVRALANDRPTLANQLLRALGVTMVGDTQRTIVSGPWTPNAPETIERKKSARPLIDSGQMRQSIRATVDLPDSTPELVG